MMRIYMADIRKVQPSWTTPNIHLVFVHGTDLDFVRHGLVGMTSISWVVVTPLKKWLEIDLFQTRRLSEEPS